MLRGGFKVTDNEVAAFSWPKRLLTSSLAYLRDAGGKEWLLTVIDQGIVSAASFLTTVIIGRACAKEQLGLYFLGWSIVCLLMELQNVLIWFPYTALSPRLKGRTAKRRAIGDYGHT